MPNVLGAEFRAVDNREYQGKPAVVAVAARTYDTSVEDLWDAMTNPERIPRWFLPIEGNLELGGRYQLEGNAGGTITRCDPPEALDLTWELGGATSWVQVRLAPDGEGARMNLEHIALRDEVGEEHLRTFGPGAVGVGWDLAIMGLGKYLASGGEAVDHDAAHEWMATDEGKAFVRECGKAWAAADAASGEDPEEAQAKAERTIGFYTGG